MIFGFVGNFIRSPSLWHVLISPSMKEVIFMPQKSIRLLKSPVSKLITLLSGSSESSRYKDGTLLQSLFYNPHGLRFIGADTLMVADRNNQKLRILYFSLNRVATLDINSLSKYKPFWYPASVLIGNTSLFVGVSRRILAYN